MPCTFCFSQSLPEMHRGIFRLLLIVHKPSVSVTWPKQTENKSMELRKYMAFLILTLAASFKIADDVAHLSLLLGLFQVWDIHFCLFLAVTVVGWSQSPEHCLWQPSLQDSSKNEQQRQTVSLLRHAHGTQSAVKGTKCYRLFKAESVAWFCREIHPVVGQRVSLPQFWFSAFKAYPSKRTLSGSCVFTSDSIKVT